MNIASMIRGLFFSGKVLDSSETAGFQTLRVEGRAGEPIEQAVNIQQYGLASRPTDGAMAALSQLGGDNGILIVVGTGKPDEIKRGLEKGETAIYCADGDFVHIKRGGVVHVKASTKVYAETPLFETSGNAKIGGNLEVLGTVHAVGAIDSSASVADPSGTMQEMRTAYNAHKGHNFPGSTPDVPMT